MTAFSTPASTSRRPPHPALVAGLAGLLVVFTAIAPAHAYVHGDASSTCTSCHLVRHSPAILVELLAVTTDVLVTPVVAAAAPRTARGIAIVACSRGPPSRS
jgi:predicted anti-sigma-YlaC factor YlaD